MSEQQTQLLVREAAEIRRRYAAETNAERRAQLTARYYQIEAELKALKTTAPITSTQALPMADSNLAISKSSVEASEPFGIRMGMPAEELGADVCPLGNGAYGLRKVPKPHSFFEGYILQSSPEAGVTNITAHGKRISVNRYGSELRSQFKFMMSRLERIYGEASLLEDELEEESSWDAADHWMLGLVEEERTLSAVWDERANIPRDLKKIWLYASADSEEEGHIVLTYESVNYEFDIEEIYAEDDESL